jgi:hypothetical protein
MFQNYEFGVNTKETSFRDLYWNKIYQFQIIYLDFNQITWKIGILLVLKVWMNVLVIKHHSHNRVDTKGNPIFSIISLS